jgi:hypothetical protein
MGHDCNRVESGEQIAQSEGETGLESLGRAVARGMPEGQVDLHLGRAVEKAQQTVADTIRLVESVDQRACCVLCTASPW